MVSSTEMMRPASKKSSGVKTKSKSSSLLSFDAVSTGADRVAVSAVLMADEVDDVALVTCFGVGIETSGYFVIGCRRGMPDRKLLHLRCSMGDGLG